MTKISGSVNQLLLVAMASLCLSGCHSRNLSQPISQSLSNSTAPALLQEIHVDQQCHVLGTKVAGVPASGSQSANLICHLESVFTSQRTEETIKDGVPIRNLVSISEQEYLLDNVTSGPVVFVVEQPVPKNWRIDSDPQPTQMVGTTAIFRVNAEPGQIVRLHVGESHSVPVSVPAG
jgi:hypothetical protein